MRTDPLSLGDLRGVILTFEVSGDTLPMHAHGEGDVHITVVARGRFRLHGPTIGDQEVAEGAVIDFGAGHPHEFIALTDNARLVNVIKRMTKTD